MLHGVLIIRLRLIARAATTLAFLVLDLGFM